MLLAYTWLLRGTALRIPRAEQPYGTALSLTRPGDGTDSAGASATPGELPFFSSIGGGRAMLVLRRSPQSWWPAERADASPRQAEAATWSPHFLHGRHPLPGPTPHSCPRCPRSCPRTAPPGGCGRATRLAVPASTLTGMDKNRLSEFLRARLGWRPLGSGGKQVFGRRSDVGCGVGGRAVVALQAGPQGLERYWRSALVPQVSYSGAAQRPFGCGGCAEARK